MKTIDEIQSELRALALELEQLKQSNDAAENLTADFKKLSANGYRYPITPHPLESFDEHANKCYLTLLLTVAQFEPEMLSESLLLAHRIAFGMNYLGEGGDLQEEFAAAQTLTFSQLDEITSLFRETDERLMLILECLLTAGAFNKGRQEAFKYIAELAVLLNVDKEQLVFLSNMAAVILTGDLGQYKCKIKNTYEIFNVYLQPLDIPIYIYRWQFERVHDFDSSGVWGATLEYINISLSGNSLQIKLTYMAGYGPIYLSDIFGDYDNFQLKISKYDSYRNRGSNAVKSAKLIKDFPIGVKSSLLCPKSFMDKFYSQFSNIDAYYEKN